jgi:hypothetical protein
MKSAILMLVLMLLFACGGEKAETPRSALAAPAPEADLSDPDVLGERIVQSYGSALRDVVALGAGLPPAEDIKAQAEETLHRCIGEFVEYGRYYREMDESQRSTVDNRLMRSYYDFGQDLFDRYSAVVSHYRPLDPELGEILAAFNIVTQYYNYELLRRQAPDEADRLGV